jgi:hypothetical protein
LISANIVFPKWKYTSTAHQYTFFSTVVLTWNNNVEFMYWW